MCLIMMLCAVLAMFVMWAIWFVESAVFLLPWSVPSALVGIVVAYGVGLLINKQREEKALLAALVAGGVTLGTALLASTAIPPQVEPIPQRPGGNAQVFSDWPKLSQQMLNENMPIHFGITAVIAAIMGSSLMTLQSSKNISDDFAEPDEQEPPEITYDI